MEKPTDTELMAYADGELPAPLAAKIAEIARADPDVQRRIERFRAVRAQLAQTLQPLAEEEVPEALRRAVLDMADGQTAADPRVVAFAPRVRPPAWRAWQVGLAASLLLMLGGVAGFLAGARQAGEGAQSVAAVGSHVSPEIARHLSSLPSGSDTGIADARLRLIATVLASDGTPCREFEVDSTGTGRTSTGIACLRDGSWFLDIAVAAHAAEGGFAPASSFATLEAYLQAIGAGEPLDAAAEAQALTAATPAD